MKFNKDSNYADILETFKVSSDEFEELVSPVFEIHMREIYKGPLRYQIDPGDLLSVSEAICKCADKDTHISIVALFCRMDELIINEI